MPKLKYTTQREHWTWAERSQWSDYELRTRRAWLVHRSQARFRGEEYNLTWAEYVEAWAGQFDQKGRSPESLTLTRRDPEGAWCLSNVVVISRREHYRFQMLERHREGVMNNCR
jgi:hypothetical protein